MNYTGFKQQNTEDTVGMMPAALYTKDLNVLPVGVIVNVQEHVELCG